MFIQRSVIVKVIFFAKPLYTQKEKLELKIYTTVHYQAHMGSQHKKTKKILERKSNSPKI